MSEGWGHHTEAHELVLYADNDANLYRQKDAFLANIHRKMKRGTYDPAQGVKLWMYFVDRAAKAYAKEFGGTWNKIFSRSERIVAAKHYEHKERGEYDKYPPVRASSGDPKRRTARSPDQASYIVVWQGGQSRPFKKEHEARSEARLISVESGETVAVVERRGYHTREVSRVRGGRVVAGAGKGSSRDPKAHHHRVKGAPTFKQQAMIARKMRILERENRARRPKRSQEQMLAIAYRYAGVPPRSGSRLRASGQRRRS